jgi:hypothetical protein
MRTLMVLAAATCAACVCAGAEVAGVDVPEEVVLGSGQPKLVLNGAGVRRKLFVDVYVGALYLPERQSDASVVVAQDVPWMISMRFLHKEVARDKLVAAWNDGFAGNTATAELAALQPRITAFNKLFSSVRRGDTIRLSYIPGTGTHVWLNSQKAGVVQGADFQRALLRIWLGEKPADKKLKQTMLGAGGT